MKGILTLVWSCLVVGLMGQTTPYINSISPITAKVGETVTIAGSGFSATSTDLRVLFGGVSAPILSSTTNLIEVSVPQGASHDEIMVINVVTGYSASSSQLFFPNYGGDSFDNLLKAELPAFFDSEVSTNTNQKLAYDLCMCDFNGDGLNDIVITAQENPTTGNASRLVYQNSS
ncbi:MAG: IPT/TIG domain-containing protein, partial [Cyclobacteriaceae bacterium]|nr:IPT/TIG domain-containing protein [Cyclobacteriaceae bacterium]